jgi:hypothetical protein
VFSSRALKAEPMAQSRSLPQQQKRTDQSALLLMLDYVEAECRALGADEAASHVARALLLLSRLSADRDGLLDVPQGRG